MNFWRGTSQLLKDCLFPIFCLECNLEGEWWCENCLKKINHIGVYYCPVCHLLNKNGQPCNRCKAVSSLNGVAAFFDYDEKQPIGELIHQFKYNFAFDILSVWKKLVETSFQDIFNKMDTGLNSITVIPVPLYLSRERERGFNQANLIAESVFKKISTFLQADFDNKSLVRIRSTDQQAKLNRSDRLKNLRGSFSWSNKKPAPKNILLIDDVFTSGATAQECAAVLKKFGAQKVYAFTLARD